MFTNHQPWLELEDPEGDGSFILILGKQQGKAAGAQLRYIDQRLRYTAGRCSTEIQGCKSDLPFLQGCVGMFQPLHDWLKQASPWKRQCSFESVDDLTDPYWQLHGESYLSDATDDMDYSESSS